MAHTSGGTEESLCGEEVHRGEEDKEAGLYYEASLAVRRQRGRSSSTHRKQRKGTGSEVRL